MDGTKTLIEACHHRSVSGAVTKLVYTSSTGVVWTPQDIAGATEDSIQIPTQGYDSYHHTKAIGEKLVLTEDGNKMRTVVLRPCGMIGCSLSFAVLLRCVHLHPLGQGINSSCIV